MTLPDARKSSSNRTIWTLNSAGELIEDCPESLRVIRSAIDTKILKDLLLEYSAEIDRMSELQRHSIQYQEKA